MQGNAKRPNKLNPLGGLPILVRKMEAERLSKEVMTFLRFTWRDSTRKVYASYLKKWATFCLSRGYDMYEPENSNIMDFLFSLIKKGASYSAVNTARCALSAVLPWREGKSIGCNEFVCMLVRAAGNFNPPKPRYSEFWDVSLVLKLFQHWGRNSLLSLYRLTIKVTVLLLLLLTAQRGQTIWRLTVSGLKIFEDHMSFKLSHMLKHNRPGEPLDTLLVPSYPKDALLCPIRAVRAYIARTRSYRKFDQLLLITRSPYTPASRDTVSRWTRQVLHYSGVDTDNYSSHSTRGATTSMASMLGIDINVLMRQASWKNADTFAKYYNKSIYDPSSTVAHVVISGSKSKQRRRKKKKSGRA